MRNKEEMYEYFNTGKSPTTNARDHALWVLDLAESNVVEWNEFMQEHKTTIMWDNAGKAQKEVNALFRSYLEQSEVM